MQRPQQGGIENGPSRRRVPGGTPFFECSFHEIAIEFLLELVQKAACKKLNKQTNIHTDRQNPADIELGRGNVLDSSHVDTSRKCLQNRPQNDPRIPVNLPVKEHLRLASVVALSSSGDCGATFPLSLIGGVAVGDLHLWRHLPPRVQF